MVTGEHVEKVLSSLQCGKLVGVVHGDDILLSDQDHLLMRCGILYEERYWKRGTCDRCFLKCETKRPASDKSSC